MNYYERHLGDYAKDTGHLSMLEHGAYNLLLDRYYSTEAGIPDEQKYRVARARSKDEKDAVDVVLSEFFVLTEGTWIKNRCHQEIEKAQRRIASARSNGVAGGRPKKNRELTQKKPTGLLVGSVSETESKALHLPSTIYQEERDSERVLDSIPDEPDQPAEPPPEIDPVMRQCGEFATVLRQDGMSKVTSMHPDLTRWVQDGFTLAKCKDALQRAKLTLGKIDGISPAYVDKILRDPGKRESLPLPRNRVVV